MAGGATALRVGLFSDSVVLRAGELCGAFGRAGLAVSAHPVRSSPEQFRDLAGGTYDVVLTSPDNVLAYRLDPANPLGRRLDVRILRAVDRGLGLSLVAVPDRPTLESLRGTAIAVDVPVSGFAFALYAVLDTAGLHPERDYRVVSLGATPRRRAALLAGECAATLLNAGHDVAAVAAGARRLARVPDVVGPYLGSVLAAGGEWLDGHAEVARRFLTAWAEATAYVGDPANREPLSERYGAGLMANMLSREDGLVVDGAIEPPALATVVGLRARFGYLPAGVDPAAAAAGGLGLLDPRFATLAGPA